MLLRMDTHTTTILVMGTPGLTRASEGDIVAVYLFVTNDGRAGETFVTEDDVQRFGAAARSGELIDVPTQTLRFYPA